MNLGAPWEQQIAWGAGLFEGEGCITLNGRTFALRLNNTDERVVRSFLEVLDLGAVYGPYEHHGARDGFKRKPFWVWVAQGDIAYESLDLLAPWLSPRRLDRAEELCGLRFPMKRQV